MYCPDTWGPGFLAMRPVAGCWVRGVCTARSQLLVQLLWKTRALSMEFLPPPVHLLARGKGRRARLRRLFGDYDNWRGVVFFESLAKVVSIILGVPCKVFWQLEVIKIKMTFTCSGARAIVFYP